MTVAERSVTLCRCFLILLERLRHPVIRNLMMPEYRHWEVCRTPQLGEHLHFKDKNSLYACMLLDGINLEEQFMVL